MLTLDLPLNNLRAMLSKIALRAESDNLTRSETTAQKVRFIMEMF